ncbi:MAG: C-terminal binding protein [Arenicellales bacterium]|nr:C-terminal binding protein [Arenicellales bacterium]
MAKVFITDFISDPVYEKDILGDHVSLDPDEDVEVVLVWRYRIDDAFLDRFPNLKGVVRYGVGTENVDFEAVSKRGIVFCNTPDYGVDEVALTAISFVLYFDRAIETYNWKCKGFQDGSWQQNTETRLQRAKQSLVGCLGAGRIGSLFLLKARALGFKTVFYDPYKPSGHEKVLGADRTDSLDELLKCSDYVSIHVSLTEETKGMVNAAFVDKMKTGSYLINTARGTVLNGLDFLVDPLKSKQLGGIALDVLPHEPPQNGQLIDAWRREEIWTRGRVLINPHTAFYSQQAFKEMRTKAAKNAVRILRGQQPLNQLI